MTNSGRPSRAKRSRVCIRLIANQIAAALETRGWATNVDKGQSRFRADIAVRKKGTDRHQLAVLVDGGAAASAIERFHTRPNILRAFGWQVAVVMAKDWWHEPEAVLDRIERLLRREIAELEEEILEEDEPIDAPPATPPEVPSQVAEAPSALPGRRFEFSAGNSRKFWSVTQENASLMIRFGRLGTTGQSMVKTFDDSPRAGREMAKLIAEKTRKGYVEAG